MTTLTGNYQPIGGTSSTYSNSMVYDHLGRRYALSESLGGSSQGNIRRLASSPPSGSSSDIQSFLYDGNDLVFRQIIGSLSSLNQPDLNTTSGPGANGVFYLYGPTGLVMEFSCGSQQYAPDSRTFLYDPQGNCNSTCNGVPYINFVTPSAFPIFYDGYGNQVWSTPSGIAPGWYPTLDRATSQPFQYKGQYGYYTDGASGLIYCINRYYDPNTGRWTQRDPTGLDGGVNVYEYCEGDPVTGFDPDGTSSQHNKPLALIILGDRNTSGEWGAMLIGGERFKDITTSLFERRGFNVVVLRNPGEEEAKTWLNEANAFAFWGHGHGEALQLRDGVFLNSDSLADVAYTRNKFHKPLLSYCILNACGSIANCGANWTGIADIVEGYRTNMRVNFRLIDGDTPDWVSTPFYSAPSELPSRRIARILGAAAERRKKAQALKKRFH